VAGNRRGRTEAGTGPGWGGPFEQEKEGRRKRGGACGESRKKEFLHIMSTRGHQIRDLLRAERKNCFLLFGTGKGASMGAEEKVRFSPLNEKEKNWIRGGGGGGGGGGTKKRGREKRGKVSCFGEEAHKRKKNGAALSLSEKEIENIGQPRVWLTDARAPPQGETEFSTIIREKKRRECGEETNNHLCQGKNRGDWDRTEKRSAVTQNKEKKSRPPIYDGPENARFSRQKTKSKKD